MAVSSSLIKFLLADEVSLEQYLKVSIPGIGEIKRRLFVLGRQQRRDLPDHYHRLEQTRSLGHHASLADLLAKGLGDLTVDYLQLTGERIFVRPFEQNNWQELITYLPPLVLQAAFLARSVPFTREPEGLRQYFIDYILHNTRYTAIPTCRILQLDHLLEQNGGFHDLHVHLNGATETDALWQDFLSNPQSVFNEMESAFKHPKVKEQMLVESQLMTPTDFLGLLRIAQRLRSWFFSYFYPPPESYDPIDVQSLLWDIIQDTGRIQATNHHEFAQLIDEEDNYPYLMSVECLMYVMILTELEQNPNGPLADFFHFYLLILGLANRLLVQQIHQKGFEQFQKHTLNGMREHSERVFQKRYQQMHGNSDKLLLFLEGRFSPKQDPDRLLDLIESIQQGWRNMQRLISTDGFKPDLRLIAHFIKQADLKENSEIRHKNLRIDLWAKARTLSDLFYSRPKSWEEIVGVDAAASEFDAPPEVFAPVFRYLRKKGIQHFTYHAGEDFYHILSGLRAIFEAILFCRLQAGDRIGHSTAAGVGIEQWHTVVGDEVLMHKGEYMDSLIFAYHLIIKLRIDTLTPCIPYLADKVQRLCQEIYRENFSLSILERAWLMREVCPILGIHSDPEEVDWSRIAEDPEGRHVFTEGFFGSREELEEDKAWQIWKLYHHADVRKRYHAIISVGVFEVFSRENLQTLQLSLLGFMNEKEIVIETLPTSNVRIGFHRSFGSYHLLNWLEWRKSGKSIPPIVVGTDDTGIFATNIYNEYANIYCCLLNERKLSHIEIMQMIKQLNEDSRIYKFRYRRNGRVS